MRELHCTKVLNVVFWQTRFAISLRNYYTKKSRDQRLYKKKHFLHLFKFTPPPRRKLTCRGWYVLPFLLWVFLFHMWEVESCLCFLRGWWVWQFRRQKENYNVKKIKGKGGYAKCVKKKIPMVGYSSYCSSRERKRTSLRYQKKESSPLEIRCTKIFFFSVRLLTVLKTELSLFLLFC